MQWNSFGIAETPDDGRLRSKHVVKESSDRNSCKIVNRLCSYRE
jgi:hypothetical protein